MPFPLYPNHLNSRIKTAPQADHLPNATRAHHGAVIAWSMRQAMCSSYLLHKCLFIAAILAPQTSYAEQPNEPHSTPTPGDTEETEPSPLGTSEPIAPEEPAQPKDRAPGTQDPQEKQPAPLGEAVPIRSEALIPPAEAEASAHRQQHPSPRRKAEAEGNTHTVPLGAEPEELYVEPRTDPRLTDAHIDHVILMPTAETQPEGTFYVSNIEILFLQLGYAFTDDLQLTVTFWPFSLVAGSPGFGDLSIKGNFFRSDRLSLAAWGGLGILRESDEGLFSGPDPETTGIARAGLSATVCADTACRLNLNFSGMAGTTLEKDRDEFVLGVLSAGAQGRLGRWFSLLLEYQHWVISNSDNDSSHVVNYGVRFSSRKFAVDTGILMPFNNDLDFPLGVPWLMLTYRAL